jgi:hypothetical protein
MAQAIYKVFMFRYKEAWYQLSVEEQNKLMAQDEESLKALGVELVILCGSAWSSEEWLAWGVEKYPDIEAVQKHADNLDRLNWFKYIESKSYLGTELPMPESQGD